MHGSLVLDLLLAHASSHDETLELALKVKTLGYRNLWFEHS
jgi:hypothetical protein